MARSVQRLVPKHINDAAKVLQLPSEPIGYRKRLARQIELMRLALYRVTKRR